MFGSFFRILALLKRFNSMCSLGGGMIPVTRTTSTQAKILARLPAPKITVSGIDRMLLMKEIWRTSKPPETSQTLVRISYAIFTWPGTCRFSSFFSNRRILFNKEGDKPSRPRYVLRESLACTKQDSSYSSQWPVTSCRNPLYIFVLCQKLVKLEHIKKVKQIHATSCCKSKQGL